MGIEISILVLCYIYFYSQVVELKKARFLSSSHSSTMSNVNCLDMLIKLLFLVNVLLIEYPSYGP